MKGSGAAMDFRSPIDPEEEARHREVMDGLGVYDAHWALSKVLELSDVKKGQNRLLLTKDTVRAGHIPKLFPELEELREDGLNAQHTVSVRVLDAEGREKAVNLRYLNSNKAYRVKGSDWKLFVLDNGMSKGDRLDLYTCRRGDDGERCLFSFTIKGWDASGNSAAWCTNGRKRARQTAAAVVRDPVVAEEDEGFSSLNGGCVNDGLHSWKGGFQWGYNAERSREDKSSWDLNATPDEREAAKGLLMLKYAIYAEHY